MEERRTSQSPKFTYSEGMTHEFPFDSIAVERKRKRERDGYEP